MTNNGGSPQHEPLKCCCIHIRELLQTILKSGVIVSATSQESSFLNFICAPCALEDRRTKEVKSDYSLHIGFEPLERGDAVLDEKAIDWLIDNG